MNLADCEEKEKVREHGEIAFHLGEKVGDNPYNQANPLHWAWLKGWVCALEIKLNNNKTGENHGKI